MTTAIQGTSPVLLGQRPVQFQGSGFARALLRVAGWQLLFDGLPARQGVLVIYPHTSNWDFVVGITAKWAIGLPLRFWGKDSLFRIPLFGHWLRWLGGIPVDRHAPQGAVGDMVRRLHEARAAEGFLWLALAPEGTRAGTAGWRSGFYRVATGADMPLALACLDYARRRVGVVACVQLCGEPEADMAMIARHLSSARGLHPEQAAPIQLRTS